jgi:hypothetical protein
LLKREYCGLGTFPLLSTVRIVRHHWRMNTSEFEEHCMDALVTEIGGALRKRLDSINDLTEALARGIMRVERRLDQSCCEKARDE